MKQIYTKKTLEKNSLSIVLRGLMTLIVLSTFCISVMQGGNYENSEKHLLNWKTDFTSSDDSLKLQNKATNQEAAPGVEKMESLTVVISAPSVLLATLDALNSNLLLECSNATNGVIDINVIGGVPPFSYSYTLNGGSPVTGSGTTITGLGPGLYSVTITDGNGCTNAIPVVATILAPDLLVATVDVINSDLIVECSGDASAEIELDVIGGTGPFSYEYSVDGGATVSGLGTTISGLIAGTYDITVTDDNGCTSILAAAAVVVELPLLVATLDLDDSDLVIECDGATGEIELDVLGGEAPYSYEYSKDLGPTVSGSGTTISGLEAGSYLITVTDDNGCSALLPAAAVITELPLLVATVDIGNSDLIVECSGEATAEIELDVIGGTEPYSFEYSLDGDAAVSGLGTTITGLVAGSYDITVLDANGCTSIIATSTAVIELDLLVATLDLDDSDLVIECDGATGEIELDVLGGEAPYSYEYSKDLGPTVSGSGTTISGLEAGSYLITVTDDNGCSSILPAAAVITELPLLVATVDIGNSDLIVECSGEATAEIELDVIGGTEPYSFEYSLDGDAAVSGLGTTITGLVAGSYDITVLDANGCTSIIATSTAVIELDLLVATLDIDDSDLVIECNGGATGVIELDVIGGEAPYSYEYSKDLGPTVSGTGTTISGLEAGSYLVTVTDDNGCSSILPAAAVITELPLLVALPDLLNSIVELDCSDDNDGEITLEVTGGTGPYTYEYTLDGGPVISGSGLTISALTPGTYLITVIDANGCISVLPAPVTITAPDPLIAAVDPINSTLLLNCSDAEDGIIELDVIGGTGPFSFSYTLDGGAPVTGSGTVITGLGAGTYEITIIDDNGCESTP